MTILRWKAQSLQFHRHLTGPESVASRQGILPLFAKLAFVIASCGGAVASMAKKRWLSGNSDMMTIARLQEIRNEINAAFDQLELEILGNDPVPVTGILSENVELAEATYDLHGNFAVLALAAMEEAAELAIPVMTIADGSQTLERARREIEPESADVRINLHIISERIGISAEHSTSLKWAEIRDRHPEDAFQVTPSDKVEISPATLKSMLNCSRQPRVTSSVRTKKSQEPLLL